ncbi:hypothetical protein Y032_0398g726 [Ancylostoma ceylanicum]|uniref:Uncharacterized protein n=2 Tax=Ancylostoma ceylanicum TaxID=53326 RepID=A0A016RSA1_9BILA|nr:hypothetical protein Y032_0398g726 [Ancylostoma ceylanicum]
MRKRWKQVILVASLAPMAERRSLLANLLNPLLELLFQPGERPLQAKISVYGSARTCLRSAYMEVQDKDQNESSSDWLSNGVVFGGGPASDPIVEVLNTRSYELSQCVSRDIVDLPKEHKVTM